MSYYYSITFFESYSLFCINLHNNNIMTHYYIQQNACSLPTIRGCEEREAHRNCMVHGPVAPVAQRYHVTSDTLGREFDPGKRDFPH